jgi:hypothetical protein
MMETKSSPVVVSQTGGSSTTIPLQVDVLPSYQNIVVKLEMKIECCVCVVVQKVMLGWSHLPGGHTIMPMMMPFDKLHEDLQKLFTPTQNVAHEVIDAERQEDFIKKEPIYRWTEQCEKNTAIAKLTNGLYGSRSTSVPIATHFLTIDIYDT